MQKNQSIKLSTSNTSVEGVDYQPNGLVFTLNTSTSEGDIIIVPLSIIGDDIVEGPHSFTVDVVAGELVVPGPYATVTIYDGDCKYTCRECLLSVMYTLCKTPLVAAVQLAAAEYTVDEDDGSVKVCVILSVLPAGGLECEIVVDLDINEGTKTSKF